MGYGPTFPCSASVWRLISGDADEKEVELVEQEAGDKADIGAVPFEDAGRRGRV
jgi:hypothetical protein